MRRVLRVITAPIFKSFKRIVPTSAFASSVRSDAETADGLEQSVGQA